MPIRKEKPKMAKQVNVTAETIQDIGEQIKDMLTGISAEIEDYKFSVASEKTGLTVEFFVKAKFKNKK